MLMQRTMIVGLAVLLFSGFAATKLHAQDDKTIEEVSFESADGVNLTGYFHKSKAGSNAPSVIMLHPYGSNSDVVSWRDLAKTLSKDYNVLRFDFRGHGKSTSVDIATFWNPRTLWSVYNLRYILGSARAANKDRIDYKEFRTNYYPMLMQDIAAARHLLDLKNDNGSANTSTIYCVGAGDAINLGTAFIATEWLRERKKPNIAIPSEVVSTRRALFPGSEPAGPDYGGAVWIGPEPIKGNAIGYRDVRELLLSPFALKTRDETQMLFIAGENDRAGRLMSQSFYDKVLLVDSVYGPNRVKLSKPKQTFMRTIDKSKAEGMKLLDGNPAVDSMIIKFLEAVTEERRNKPRKQVDWDQPLYIEPRSFGF